MWYTGHEEKCGIWEHEETWMAQAWGSCHRDIPEVLRELVVVDLAISVKVDLLLTPWQGYVQQCA